MDQQLEALMDRLRQDVDLEPMTLDPALTAQDAYQRPMQLNCFNWRAERFAKISVMQTSVEVPPMNQLNSIFYPQPVYDFPIFLFLHVLTKSNVIAIININCPFADKSYTARYVDPLVPIRKKYPPLEGKDRYPEWFEKYRNDATVFGVYSKDQADQLAACGLDYLQAYLKLAAEAPKVDAPDRLERIARFHEQFKNDIRNKDRGRLVLAKLTSEETARKIFYEVAT
jgi:hypothetical protein